jgi:hypothetical protein
MNNEDNVFFWKHVFYAMRWINPIFHLMKIPIHIVDNLHPDRKLVLANCILIHFSFSEDEHEKSLLKSIFQEFFGIEMNFVLDASIINEMKYNEWTIFLKPEYLHKDDELIFGLPNYIHKNNRIIRVIHGPCREKSTNYRYTRITIRPDGSYTRRHVYRNHQKNI